MSDVWNNAVTRNIEVDANTTLRVVRRHATGRSLVLLHGGLHRLEDLGPLAAELDGYDLIAVDTRGHGGSTLGEAEMSYAQLAQDLECVIDALEIDDPILVGHSDGGILAAWVAAREEVSIAGLVLMNSGLRAPKEAEKELYDGLTEKRWRKRFAQGVAAYESLNPSPDFTQLFRHTVRMWRDDTSGDNYPGKAARDITCPTLILGGDSDHLVPVEALVWGYRAIDDASLAVLPGGVHTVPTQQPVRVARLIREFIARVDG